MIPEAAGATPFGIFLLADSYLEAAKLVLSESRVRRKGPSQLLACHASELYLKTFLRSHGQTVKQLRSLNHDISEMLEQARIFGLQVPRGIRRQAAKIQASNGYVQVRYAVVQQPTQLSAKELVMFAEGVRECIRTALDFDPLGMPQSKSWQRDAPEDYLAAGRPLSANDTSAGPQPRISVRNRS
jgi:HEPN domain-containing protein